MIRIRTLAVSAFVATGILASVGGVAAASVPVHDRPGERVTYCDDETVRRAAAAERREVAEARARARASDGDRERRDVDDEAVRARRAAIERACNELRERRP
jgi:hypothetical protein